MFAIIALCLSQATLYGGEAEDLTFDCVSLGYPSDGIFSMVAALVSAEPTDACGPIQSASGKLVVVSAGGCFFETKLKNVQDSSATAMMLFSGDGSGSSIYVNNLDMTRFSIGAVEVASSRLQSVRDRINSYPNSTWVTLTSQENRWKYYTDNKAWIFFDVCMSTLNLLLILFCAHRINLFRKTSYVPCVCYGLIMCGALTRLVACFDYHGANRLLPYSARTVLSTISFPFAIASTAILGIYIIKAFSTRHVLSNIENLRHFGLKFTLAAVLLFGMEIATATFRVLLVNSPVTIIVTVTVYVAADLLTLGFFIYNCYRIWMLRKISTAIKIGSSGSSRTLNHLLRTGIAQVVIICVATVWTTCFLIPGFTNPIPGSLWIPFLHLAVTLFNWVQAIMFIPANRPSSTNGSLMATILGTGANSKQSSRVLTRLNSGQSSKKTSTDSLPGLPQASLVLPATRGEYPEDTNTITITVVL